MIIEIDGQKNTDIWALVSHFVKGYRFLKGVLRALIGRWWIYMGK